MRLPVLVEPAIRPHLVTLACLFAVTSVLGGLAPDAMTAPLIAMLGVLVQPYRGLPHGQLFAAILVHNLVASFLSMIAGVMLGILPLVSIAANGFLLGAVCRHASRTQGLAEIAARTVPHGVFELPAMLIAASYGLWLGMTALAHLRGTETAGIGARVGHAVRRYLIIVLPLLIVAALIESRLASTPRPGG